MSSKLTIQQQFERSMTLLAWFRNNPDASFLRASRELSMSVPQIRHELSKLMMCGLPNSKDMGFLIDINIGKTSASVMQDAGLTKPINLSVMEAGVLLLSLEAVRSTLPSHRHAAVDSAADKIRALMRGHKNLVEAQELADLASGSNDLPETLDVASDLASAVNERCLVTCDYRSIRSDDLRERLLVPDHLGLIEGNIYLWAREVELGTEHEQRAASVQKKFRVERMDNVRVGEAGSANFAGLRMKPSINPDDPFGFEEGTTGQEWASLVLEPEARWMMEYYPMWQEWEDSDGDETTIDVAFPDTGVWLERFLIANAERITAKGPESLHDRVRQRAKRGLSAYSRAES